MELTVKVREGSFLVIPSTIYSRQIYATSVLNIGIGNHNKQGGPKGLLPREITETHEQFISVMCTCSISKLGGFSNFA